VPGLSVLSEILQAVLVAGVLVLVTRAFVQNFRVDGVSMLPTFEAGQALVVNRAAYFHLEGTPFEGLLPTSAQGSVNYLFGGPRRGDVVVFRAPPQPDADYIKRVIGLPGDRIQIANGRVLINGQPLEEPYISFPADYTFPNSGEPLVVPDASYFVLGDNRPESFDSHLGWVVPVDYLVGRAWLRYWPPSEVAVVDSGRSDIAAAKSTP
jgi:signal peptidase I